jgi:hypothetical protein
MNGCQEVIAVQFQQLVVRRDAGCDEFGDASFHDAFREFWIFQLVADRDAVSRFHEFVEVCVE